MASILDVSSDSDEILLQEHRFEDRKRSFSEDYIESLVNEYITEFSSEVRRDGIESRSSDEDLNTSPLKKMKKSNFYTRSNGNEIQKLQLSENYNTERLAKYRGRQNKIKFKKRNVEETQTNCKDIVEQEKYFKETTAATDKEITECLKSIVVEIDDNIVNEEYGKEIIKTLQEANIDYKIKSQAFPGMITWIRKDSLKDNGKVILTTEEQNVDTKLLIMNSSTFVTHILENTLCSHIQSLQSKLSSKKITLAIFGLKKFLNQRKKTTGQTSTNDGSDDVANISRTKLEFNLTELQLLFFCSHRIFDLPADLGLFVAQFTKAVAEIPLKLQRHAKFLKMDWFAAADNRDSVKIDNNGNGLSSLWRQMLTTFSFSRLETAEAIASRYPSITSLMMGYERCTSHKEAESLLQDIPIRRAAGPLSSTRKIGPELGKKIHNFFTAIDGEALL